MLTKLWRIIHKHQLEDILGFYAYSCLEGLGILDKHAQYFVEGMHSARRPYTVVIKVKEINSIEKATQKISIRYDDTDFLGRSIPVKVSHSSTRLHQLLQPYGECKECLPGDDGAYDLRNFYASLFGTVKELEASPGGLEKFTDLEILGDLEAFTDGFEEFTDSEAARELEAFITGFKKFTDYIRREDFASFFEQFVQDFLPIPWD